MNVLCVFAGRFFVVVVTVNTALNYLPDLMA